MIKKFLGFIFVFTLCISAFASEFKQLPYDGIKDGEKIKLTETQEWTDKVKNKDLETPLFKACENGYDNIVEYLLKYGASSNAFTIGIPKNCDHILF